MNELSPLEAALLLYLKLDAAYRAGTISPTDETEVYLSMKQSVDRGTFKEDIADIMGSEVPDVPWDKVTIDFHLDNNRETL